MEENKCVICGGPLGENTIPSWSLDGDVCLEKTPPATPCEFLDKALNAAGWFRATLLENEGRFESLCELNRPYNIRRNGGLKSLDCGHLPAIRAAVASLQRVLDRAIANPGGPNVQE